MTPVAMVLVALGFAILLLVALRWESPSVRLAVPASMNVKVD
jgi:hypothetical protein